MAFAASGSRPMSWPPRSTVPAVGASNPVIRRMVVVLPAPFGPMKPNTAPASIVKSRSATATVGPYALRR